MTTQTIACSACGADVPYGRLSCPSCGELLAAVAGARRPGAKKSRAATRAAATRAVEPDPVDDVAMARDLEAELPWTAPADERSSRATDEVGAGEREVDAAPVPDVTADDDIDDDDIDDDDEGADLNGLRSGSSTMHVGDGPTTWAVGGGLTGSVTPRYMPRPAPRSADAPDAVAAMFAPAPADPAPADPPSVAFPMPAPGAYVPPLPISAPAGPPAPARAWAGPASSLTAAGHGAPASDARVGGSAAPAAAGRASVDIARITEFAGWLSVAGAAFAAVGFLLPWARVVIGATGVNYVDRWGLAGQNHVLVVLGVLALLVLGLVGNPVPVWVRAGIGGLGLGPLLLGLVWPYLFVSALSSGPGIPIVAVGALALIVAGVLALVVDRHGSAAPRV